MHSRCHWPCLAGDCPLPCPVSPPGGRASPGLSTEPADRPVSPGTVSLERWTLGAGEPRVLVCRTSGGDRAVGSAQRGAAAGWGLAEGLCRAGPPAAGRACAVGSTVTSQERQEGPSHPQHTESTRVHACMRERCRHTWAADTTRGAHVCTHGVYTRAQARTWTVYAHRTRCPHTRHTRSQTTCAPSRPWSPRVDIVGERRLEARAPDSFAGGESDPLLPEDCPVPVISKPPHGPWCLALQGPSG